MALEGARGRTAREMREVLGFGAEPALETVHSEMAALLGAIHRTDDRPAGKEIRQRIEVLRQQHEDLIRAMMAAMDTLAGWPTVPGLSAQRQIVIVRSPEVARP